MISPYWQHLAFLFQVVLDNQGEELTSMQSGAPAETVNKACSTWTGRLRHASADGDDGDRGGGGAFEDTTPAAEARSVNNGAAGVDSGWSSMQRSACHGEPLTPLMVADGMARQRVIANRLIKAQGRTCNHRLLNLQRRR